MKNTSLLNTDLIDKNFPHDEYRDGQKECIEKILTAFDTNKFVIIEAPTGSGKSPIALAISKFFDKSFYLTTQKILQSQIINDYGDNQTITDLKGRNAYVCKYWDIAKNATALPPGEKIPPKPKKRVGCNAGVCKVRDNKSKCIICVPDHQNALCPYWDRLFAAQKASTVVMNFNSFLFQTSLAKSFTKRNLLIIDETHNAESQLLDFVGLNLTDAIFRPLKFPEFATAAEYAEFIKKHDLLNDIGKRAKLALFAGHIEKAEDLDHLKRKLEMFLEANHSHWVCDWKESKNKISRIIELKPIFVDNYAKDCLFNFADKILMMSATVLAPDEMCGALGIDRTEMFAYKMANRFPAENRPIYLTNIGSLSYRNKKQTLPKIIKAVNKIVSHHKGERGIIHTHNFEIANLLMEECDYDVSKRFSYQMNFNNKDEMLQHHSKTSDSVIVAPAMHEGLDLKDDLSRFSIICKVPYPSLRNNSQLAARMELSSSYYDWITALKLVQSYGRSVRSETDHAVTYILDSDVNWFLKKAKGLMPDWFIEAIKS